MSKQGDIEWIAKRRHTMMWLRDTFPIIFSSVIKPLKIGITKDIMALNMDGTPEEAWVSRAIGYHVGSNIYLRCMKAGIGRFNLQGCSSGVVTEQEAMRAREALNRRQKKGIQKANQVKLERKLQKEKNEKEGALLTMLMNDPFKNTGTKKTLTLTKKRQSEPQVNQIE